MSECNNDTTLLDEGQNVWNSIMQPTYVPRSDQIVQYNPNDQIVPVDNSSIFSDIGGVVGGYYGGPLGTAIGSSLGEPIWDSIVDVTQGINGSLNSLVGANIFPLFGNLGATYSDGTPIPPAITVPPPPPPPPVETQTCPPCPPCDNQPIPCIPPPRSCCTRAPPVRPPCCKSHCMR